VIRVNDEAWRGLPIAGLGEYYQSAFALSRETGRAALARAPPAV